MKFQIEWATSFKKWWEKQLLSQSNSDALMKIAWDYISTNVETAVLESDNEESITVQYFKAWLDVFYELSGVISVDCLTKI